MKRPLKKKPKKMGLTYKEAINESFASMYGGGTPIQETSNRNPTGFSIGSMSTHPHRSMTGPTGWDIDRIRAEEEQTSKAPTLMPFPLDAVFDHIADSLTSLEHVRVLMDTAIKNNSTLHPEKLGKLKKMRIYIEKTIKHLTIIGKNIESINLEEI